MQLYVILLVAIPVAAAAGGGLFDAEAMPFGPWWAVAAALAPQAAVVVAAELAVRRGLRGLDRGLGDRALTRAARTLVRLQWLTLPFHAGAVLLFGWAGAVRLLFGDLILVDDAIVAAPPLAAVMGCWWCWHPLERRRRDWETLHRIDLGLPMAAPTSRGGYVWQQSRMHLFLLLGPMALAVAAAELAEATTRWIAPDGPAWTADAAALAAVLAVLALSPLSVRRILETEPLTEAPLREELLAVCRRNRVRVGDLLVWRTGRTMLNGAVVGFVAPLRYVMLTDLLLELLSPRQLCAVMAHEVGHVRCRHMPAMLAVLAGLGCLAVLAAEGMSGLLGLLDPGGRWSDAAWVELLIVSAGVALALFLFGFVSRRLERQADTFAVTDLSRAEEDDAGVAEGRRVSQALGEGDRAESDSGEAEHHAWRIDLRGDPERARDGVLERRDSGDGDPVRPGRISASAVAAMCGALEAVAISSDGGGDRRNWRHGSVRWRQAYLRSLVGQPVQGLAIHRQLRWMLLGLLTPVLVLAALELWRASEHGPHGVGHFGGNASEVARR